MTDPMQVPPALPVRIHKGPELDYARLYDNSERLIAYVLADMAEFFAARINSTLDELRPRQPASDEAIYTKADAEALCKIAVAAATLHAEDMVLVPKEPTKAMLRAAEEIPAIQTINAWCAEMQIVRGREANWNSDDLPLAQAYRAMLAAAQSGNENVAIAITQDLEEIKVAYCAILNAQRSKEGK